MSKKMPGPEVGYTEMLDLFTVQLGEKAAEGPPKNPLRPSSAGKCTRELAFEYARFKGLEGYTGIPNEAHSAEVQRIFKMGHAVENHLKWEFRKAFTEAGGAFSLRYGQQVVRIMKLNDGSFLEGSVDDVFYSEKHKALVDYKSKKDKFSQTFKTGWDEDNAKYEQLCETFGKDCFYIDDLAAFMEDFKTSDPFTAANIYQLNLYFHDMHEFFQEIGVDHCVLIYKNKNDSRVRELRFKPSKKVYEDTVLKFKTADEAVTVHGDPIKAPTDFALGSVKCAFCSWATVCHGDDTDPKKAFFQTLPGKSWPKDTDRMYDQDAAQRLESLYAEWSNCTTQAEKAKGLEQEMIRELDNMKCWKVGFSDGKVFSVKRYKTGGVAGGPRKALKKDKK